MPKISLCHGGFAIAEGVRALYRQGQIDYSLPPLILVDAQGKPIGRIEDGDTVIFCCKRGEREIQLTEAFTETGFNHFPRALFRNLTFVPLTLYHEKFKNLPVAFAPTKIKDTLGEIVSRAQLPQLHVAESEKFAHVTFFLNGGENQPFDGEEDSSLPSPKGVPPEKIPELSLPQVADRVLTGINQGYPLIAANFANGDVIGHTLNRHAKLQCAELVDLHLGRVVSAALLRNYTILVTADHGNLEEMTHPDGTPHGSHTANPVPFLMISPHLGSLDQVADGKLADIAPTILHLLAIEPPEAMLGRSLIPRSEKVHSHRVLLVILDGWGLGKQDDTNPIYLARTPNWDGFTRSYPFARLQAAGEAVGLKTGKPGNSEAGHINIGAGRVVLQDDVRLDLALQDGSFYTNPTLCGVIQEVANRNSRLHLIGLLSEKSSHGSIDYPLALLKLAKEKGLENAYIHLIFDGRSTTPGSAPELLERLDREITGIGIGQIVSGIGRGIALDRDGNYAKTRCAYDAFVFGIGNMCVFY